MDAMDCRLAAHPLTMWGHSGGRRDFLQTNVVALTLLNRSTCDMNTTKESDTHASSVGLFYYCHKYIYVDWSLDRLLR